MKEAVFSVGDKVRVILYGSLYWQLNKPNSDLSGLTIISENEDIVWIDMSPCLVGKEGVIEEVTLTQEAYSYALNGIKEKHSWYNENQLELITTK